MRYTHTQTHRQKVSRSKGDKDPCVVCDRDNLHSACECVCVWCGGLVHICVSFQTFIDYMKAPIRVTRPCKFTDRFLQEPEADWAGACVCVRAHMPLLYTSLLGDGAGEREYKINSLQSESHGASFCINCQNPLATGLKSTFPHLKSIDSSE